MCSSQSSVSLEDEYPEIICNLTQDIMIDPVITNNGISYERSAIEDWLENKNICPVTDKYLDKSLLINNYTLKNLILKLNNKICNKSEKKNDKWNELSESKKYRKVIELYEKNNNLQKKIVILQDSLVCQNLVIEDFQKKTSELYKTNLSTSTSNFLINLCEENNKLKKENNQLKEKNNKLNEEKNIKWADFILGGISVVMMRVMFQ